MPRANHERQVLQRRINYVSNQPLVQSNQGQAAPILRPICLAAAQDSADPETETETEADSQARSLGLGLILDGVIVGTHAGGMVVEIALATEMTADAVDVYKTIYPHPTPAAWRLKWRIGVVRICRRCVNSFVRLLKRDVRTYTGSDFLLLVVSNISSPY